jgi:hypothetical protein
MDCCSFAMVAIRPIIQLVVTVATPESSDLSPTSFSSKIPIIETVIERSDLHPLTLDFVRCPKCSKCYLIDSNDSYAAIKKHPEVSRLTVSYRRDEQSSCPDISLSRHPRLDGEAPFSPRIRGDCGQIPFIPVTALLGYAPFPRQLHSVG